MIAPAQAQGSQPQAAQPVVVQPGQPQAAPPQVSQSTADTTPHRQQMVGQFNGVQ